MDTRDSHGTSRSKEDALAWFVRMQSGDTSPADHAGFTRWLEADPKNQIEYAKLGEVWRDLDRIDLPSSPALAATARGRNRSLSRRVFLGGAAFAAAASGAVVLPRQWDTLRSDHVTGVGELQDVSLPDGSFVKLDADSAIALDFSAVSRRLELLRGRAYFDVAHDPDRPFSVAAQDGTITALGTRFIVHEWDETVTVTVEEHSVSVEGPNKGQQELAAGQMLSYDRAGLGTNAPVDMEIAGAWRDGKLVFEDRPLRQVLADVNRYRTGTIQSINLDLLNMRVSGLFDIHNPDGVLEAITTTLPVRSVSLSPYLVLLLPA